MTYLSITQKKTSTIQTKNNELKNCKVTICISTLQKYLEHLYMHNGISFKILVDIKVKEYSILLVIHGGRLKIPHVSKRAWCSKYVFLVMFLQPSPVLRKNLRTICISRTIPAGVRSSMTSCGAGAGAISSSPIKLLWHHTRKLNSIIFSISYLKKINAWTHSAVDSSIFKIFRRYKQLLNEKLYHTQAQVRHNWQARGFSVPASQKIYLQREKAIVTVIKNLLCFMI